MSEDLDWSRQLAVKLYKLSFFIWYRKGGLFHLASVSKIAGLLYSILHTFNWR